MALGTSKKTCRRLSVPANNRYYPRYGIIGENRRDNDGKKLHDPYHLINIGKRVPLKKIG